MFSRLSLSYSHGNAPFFTRVSLVAGLVIGLLAAFYSVLTPTFETSVDNVASVNGTPISREKYLSHLQALAADKKDPMTEADARFVLERIIEEELLVQRGLEVGLVDSDRRTRAAIVEAMISMTTADAESKQPTKEDIENFYENNRAYFSGSASLRVQQWVVTDQDSAEQLRQRLNDGEDVSELREKVSMPAVMNPPNALLPLAKLREYIGPTAAENLARQEPGFVSEPQSYGSGYRLFHLLERRAAEAPALESIRDQVEAELVRRRGDQSLREYFDWLKGRSEILYPETLPFTFEE